MGSSDDSSSGSTDEDCKNLSPEDKHVRKEWKKGVRKGTIAPGTVEPWRPGGAAWVPPPRKAKSCKHSSGDKDKKHCSGDKDKKHSSGDKDKKHCSGDKDKKHDKK